MPSLAFYTKVKCDRCGLAGTVSLITDEDINVATWHCSACYPMPESALRSFNLAGASRLDLDSAIDACQDELRSREDRFVEIQKSGNAGLIEAGISSIISVRAAISAIITRLHHKNVR